MSGTLEQPWKMYDLANHPDVAQEYGTYMAAFSIMENTVYLLFSKMLGNKTPNFGNAQSILGHIQSLSLKLTTVENYLPHSALGEPSRKDAADAIAITRECNKFRNSLAHGMFVLTGEGELHLAAYAFETTRQTRPIPIDATTIRDRRTLDVDRGKMMLNRLVMGEPIPAGLRREPTLVPQKKPGLR